jgi:hypothetical protein
VLEQFSPSVRGQLAVELQRYFAEQAIDLLKELLIEAAVLWRTESYSRYGDDELSCTVRMFDCADRVLRANEYRWPLVRVQYDGTQPTRDMRAGLADPKKAPRPDINVFVGSELINVEAKVLKDTSPYPRNYVARGMRRFVTGYYGVGQSGVGAMLAYVVSGAMVNIAPKVNKVIEGEADFGASATMLEVDRPSAGILIFSSDHGKVSLHHQVIEISKFEDDTRAD